jgi:hypothetical protein
MQQPLARCGKSWVGMAKSEEDDPKSIPALSFRFPLLFMPLTATSLFLISVSFRFAPFAS